MPSEKVQNMDRIKSIIASGLQGHELERNIDKFYAVGESLVKSFEQATDLNIEDEGVYVNEVNLALSSRGQDPDRDVSIVYQKRHAGLFPFPHDHRTWRGCWKVEEDGEMVEYCIEIEYPVNIEWPVVGILGEDE